jgi:hypothetical protein
MKTETKVGLPKTDGKWVEDRDHDGQLLGWLELFSNNNSRRWFFIPGASRYVRISAAFA